jgi:hypothetical protein
MHRHIGKHTQVVGGTPGKRWFNLIGIDHPALPNQFGQKSCVVAGARAHMDDPFAFLWSQRSETEGVKGRLPIVERSFSAEGDDNILIKNSRIICERLNIP